MNEVVLKIGTVREVENVYSKDSADGLRVRAELIDDKAQNLEDVPWAVPLLPKVFHVIPKVGEAVVVVSDVANNPRAQRYYLGPII